MSCPSSSSVLTSETASKLASKSGKNSTKAPISIRYTCQMCGTLFKQRNTFDRHVEQCGDQLESEDGKTKHTLCNLNDALVDVPSARLTRNDNKQCTEPLDKVVGDTRVVESTVKEALVQPMKSKRKRKLKDFSDFETDFNVQPKRQQINRNDQTKNLNTSRVDKCSKVFKSDGTKHTDVQNVRLSRNKPVSKLEKRKLLEFGEGSNKLNNVDTNSVDITKSENTEHLDENRDIPCDKKQTIGKKRNVLKWSQSGFKQSSSKIKVLSARIVPHLESSDRHHAHVGNIETETVLEKGTGRPVPQNIKIAIKTETCDGDISGGEVGSVCVDDDVDGHYETSTAVVPLSELNEDIKPCTYAEIHTDYNTSTEDKHQDVETRNWFNFSNLKHAIFKCEYENCSFTASKHSVWLHHFKRTHLKKSKKYPKPSCMKCNYSAHEKRVLKEHLLVKHNDSPTSPVGYQHCSILHEVSRHVMEVLACIFCGFMLDSVNFSEGHKCERLKFYFYCPWCDHKEIQYEAMNSHIQSSHADEIIYRKEVPRTHKNVRTSEKDPACHIGDHETFCEKCQVEFENNNDLKVHVNNEHAIYSYGCGICRLSYGRLGSIREHMKKVHLLAHQCSTCKRRFGCQSDLVRHESVHLDVKPIKCDYCDRRYADKGALNCHIGLKHPTEWNNGIHSVGNDQPESYMCHLCGEHFETIKQFQRHQQKKHLDKDTEIVELLHCKICLHSFNSQRKYSTHRCTAESSVKESMVKETNAPGSDTLMGLLKQAGSGKKLKCNLCNNWLGNRKSLKQHLFRVHLNDYERSYVCNVCERRFWKKEDLLVHHRIHSNSKPYHCKICSKSFRQLGHIKEHLLSHARNSKFPCPLCSHAFKTKPSLRRHVLGHCKMFPFECPVRSCPSKSATLALLFSHMRNCTETNRPDYVCKICDQDSSLVDVQSAIAHMKSHEKDSIYLCVTCDESFTTSVSLCWHKIKSDHFSDDERSEASSSQTKTKQYFKCKEVDSDIPLDELINMYDYVKQHDVESVDGEVMRGTVLINGVEEHMAEQNIYMDDQTTLLKQEYSEMNTIIDHEQLPPFVETVELSQTDGHDHMMEKVIKSKNVHGSTSSSAVGTKHTYMCQDEEVGTKYLQSNNPSFIEFPVSSDLLSGNSDDGINTVVVTTSDTYNEQEQVAIDGDSQVISELNKTGFKTSYLRGEQDRHIPEANEETRTDEKMAVPLDNNALAGLKILDENGDEVRMYNQEGVPIPIEGNLDVLQTVLSTMKYSILLTSSNTETKQAITAIEQSVQDTAAVDALMRVVSKHTGERVDEVVTESGRVDIIGETNDTSVNVRSVKKVRKKKSKDSVNNVDKINGIFTDYEAEVTNKKNVNGLMNYKVRLCYYEDRSKNEDQYPLKCDVCDKRYKKTKHLNMHKKVHLSNEERPHQCDECGRGFTTNHTLRNHRRVHTGERPFKCHQCNKSFRQLGHLQTHLRTHADYRPFQCCHCNKSFLTNSLLTVHMKVNHCSDEQSSVNNLTEDNICDICGKNSHSVEELRIHKTKHLSKEQESKLLRVFNYAKTLNADPDVGAPTIDSSQDADAQTRTKPMKKKNKGGKPRMCDICGKVVKSLNRHKMLHVTDSSVSCAHCQKTFTTSVLLQSHIRKYHPDESFQCDVCGKKLVHRVALHNHMKVHNRSLYNCLKCKKKYVSKTLFFGHLAACVGDNFMQQLDACFD